MLVSIVIPSFQQAFLLERALKSIESQLFTDYEILVMDGGSKDDTATVVARFSHLPLSFYSEKDAGIYDAMNKGVKQSKGDYIYFMGCDDRLASPDTLQKVFSVKNITDNHVIYGNVLFPESGQVYYGEFTYYKLYIYNISHQAIFTRREVFDKLGLFNLRYKAFADYEFNMRWFDAPDIKRKYVPITVAIYETTGFSSQYHDIDFAADQWQLKKKYFPKIVRYLAVRQDKFAYKAIAKLLTDKRIVALNFMRDWLE